MKMNSRFILQTTKMTTEAKNQEMNLGNLGKAKTGEYCLKDMSPISVVK
jgi:hypothetical protein